MNLNQITRETCIVRNTSSRKGRTLAVGPGQTASRFLRYGRIILDDGDAPIHVETGPLETGLICLNGAAGLYACAIRLPVRPAGRLVRRDART